MHDFSTLWGDYARYLPAINDTYARFAATPATKELQTRLPPNIKPVDLDFLNRRTRLTYWPNVLYTAVFGTKDKAKTIVSGRERGSGFVLGDSGGYAIISGALKASQASFREDVLRWQERQCDIGIILDVPTRSLSFPNSGFTTLQQCLDRTIDNIKFVLAHRSSSALKLLNVMQGRNHKEAKYWCDSVSPYNLEGLAIAGDTRLDMWFWISRFVEMLDQNKFDHIQHIHFLGTCQPRFAVLATALQRALRKHVRDDISVTFDSSFAFRIGQQFGQFTTGMTLGQDGFKLTSHTLARFGDDVNRLAPFPFASPIGDRCKVGDILSGDDPQRAAIDIVGSQLLSNHAVHMELSSVLMANRLVDMAQTGPNAPVPWSIRQGVDAIDKIFAARSAGETLKTHKKFLNFVAPDEPDRVMHADGMLQ